MKRQILISGVIGGILIALLKWSDYQFLVINHSVEIYGGLTAATFAALGIWLGLRLSKPYPTSPSEGVTPPELPVAPLFLPDDASQVRLGITRRELEILHLVAAGLSNREIAGKLFVSENTVKTHCSRAFDKLGARRRTQAVQLGKEFGLLP